VSRKIEFIQRKFTRPNCPTFERDGDFDKSYHFMPNPVGHGLRRAPAWSSHVAFPAGFTTCRGMFYDAANGRVVFIGTKNSHLATTYLTFSSGAMAAAATEIDTGTATLGGTPGCQFVYWAGYLYYFRSSRDMYRSETYDTAATSVYTNSNGQAVTIVAERPVLADWTGELYMLDRADTFMHIWYVATGFTVRYMLPMDGHLVMFCQRPDGGMQIVRINTDPAYAKYLSDAIAEDISRIDAVIPDPAHLVTIPGTANHSAYGCLFAEHQGDVFFSAGRAKNKTYIHRFNGSSVELADEIPYTVTSAACDGLLSWQDQLFFYSIDTGISYLRVWMGEGFTYLSDKSFTLGSSLDTCVAAAGPTVAVVDNPSGTQGVYYLTTNFSPDAKLTTCHVDLGHPGRLKRLNRIVITFNDTSSSTATCTVQYSLNQSATLATIQTATLCSSAHVIEPSTQVEFYTIQLVLTFADSAAPAQPSWVNNIVPESIAILATVED